MNPTRGTVVTLEDLLETEERIKKHIDLCLVKHEDKPKPLFYKPSQVAAMIGLSTHSIRRKLCDPNETILKGIQQSGVKGSWLIPKESVDAWIATMKRKP